MSRISKSVIAFVTIHLIAAVTTQEMEKRGPQGFLGMRGKKYEDGPDQFYKIKPQFFVGVKGKKDVDINDLIEPDYFKRAPMGFMGMRGKKDVFDGKRAPMGFVGMRGKKDFFEDKRGPMGFVGMRGKKDEFDDTKGSLIGQIDYAANSDNDFPLLNEILTEYLNRLQEQDSESEERITNEVEKRARLHQFYGVRGKKSLQSKRPYDVSFRGKFIGVRGKKDVPPQEINFLLDQSEMSKRKGAMGFIGMRGKKWDDESSPESPTQ